MKDQRIVWIDWAKAILIYLMVVGHCLPVEWQSTLIYAFHMPAFFIISGYLYRQHHWGRILKSFVLPVVFFSIINFIIYAFPKIIKGTFSTNSIMERLFLPFWGGTGNLADDEYVILFPGVWFIIALLLGRLLMGDIRAFSWVSRYWKIVLVVLIAFLSLEPYIFSNNPLHAYKWYLVVPSMPFILLGYGMHNKIQLFELVKPWMVILGIILFVMASLVKGRSEILGCNYGCYLVYFLNAVLGGVLLFYGCSKLGQNRIIEVFSKGTLLVMAFNLVLHSYISAFFRIVGLGVIANERLFVPWLISFFIMVICYFPIKWLLNNYPSLLGK